jgi:nicotinic acid mononucleotide adenylyltransferase
MAAAERIDAFVVCHGSFNPVHRDHVAIMVQARAALEAAGYRVVAGVLAPCDRTRLFWKCRRDTIDDDHRLKALQLACVDAEGPAGWLGVDARGCQHTSGWSLIKVLNQEHTGAVGFDILGSDVVVNCYWRNYGCLAQRPCVIVGRAGFTAAARKGLRTRPRPLASGEDDNCAAATNKMLFLSELPGDLSSTRVRKALADGDAAGVAEMCSPGVAAYLQLYKDSLYTESAAQANAEAEAQAAAQAAAEAGSSPNKRTVTDPANAALAAEAAAEAATGAAAMDV